MSTSPVLLERGAVIGASPELDAPSRYARSGELLHDQLLHFGFVEVATSAEVSF